MLSLRYMDKMQSLQLLSLGRCEKLWPRISNWFLRREKISPEDFAVTMHQVAVIFSQKLFALGPVIGWKLVPRHAWLEVMGEMQIVIEEHQRQGAR